MCAAATALTTPSTDPRVHERALGSGWVALTWERRGIGDDLSEQQRSCVQLFG